MPLLNFGLNTLFGILSSSASNPTPLTFDSEMRMVLLININLYILLIVIAMKMAKGYYILGSGLETFIILVFKSN